MKSFLNPFAIVVYVTAIAMTTIALIESNNHIQEVNLMLDELEQSTVNLMIACVKLGWRLNHNGAEYQDCESYLREAIETEEKVLIVKPKTPPSHEQKS